MSARPTSRRRVEPLDWSLTPAEALRCWPTNRPLACLVSAGGACGWSRWVILASTSPRAEAISAPGQLDDLDESIHNASTGSADPDRPPFVGGWIGWLGYDLGRCLEPRAAHAGGALDDRGWPALQLQRCDGALVFDRLRRRWWRVGDPAACVEFGEENAGAEPLWSVGEPRSATGRAGYTASVARALDYIRAGDIYQASIAHRLSAPFEGSQRALFARLCEAMGPWYAGLIESPKGDRAVLSASPELFLSLDAATRRVVTRPIKGTRPASMPPAELLDAEKDEAELTMIVDLMRNDLGRVCDFGSVRVVDPRSIETHGGVGELAGAGVHHAVATVEGRLRAGAGIVDLIRAAFPGGSVTGAPKIRAMQIIDELEAVRRGPYCGAVGYISDDGGAQFNIAIRTASIVGESVGGSGVYGSLRGELDYSVGAGIVADSDPEAEWCETMAKAEGFLRSVVASPEPAGAAS